MNQPTRTSKMVLSLNTALALLGTVSETKALTHGEHAGTAAQATMAKRPEESFLKIPHGCKWMHPSFEPVKIEAESVSQAVLALHAGM